MKHDIIVPSLASFSTSALQKEIQRRQKNRDTRIRNKCVFTCWQCKETTKLTRWVKLESYYYQDDVYTQNYVSNRDSYDIICPLCHNANRCLIRLDKWHTMENASQNMLAELKNHSILEKFEKVGKFAHECVEYAGQIYGDQPTFFEYINGKKVKIDKIPNTK